MRKIVFYRDNEDGGWIAEVPSMPGCISDGATRKVALANIRKAMRAWVDAQEVLKAAGRLRRQVRRLASDVQLTRMKKAR